MPHKVEHVLKGKTAHAIHRVPSFLNILFKALFKQSWTEALSDLT